MSLGGSGSMRERVWEKDNVWKSYSKKECERERKCGLVSESAGQRELKILIMWERQRLKREVMGVTLRGKDRLREREFYIFNMYLYVPQTTSIYVA